MQNGSNFHLGISEKSSLSVVNYFGLKKKKMLVREGFAPKVSPSIPPACCETDSWSLGPSL